MDTVFGIFIVQQYILTNHYSKIHNLHFHLMCKNIYIGL